MKNFVRVAIAQINVTVGDLESNLKKIFDYIDKAGRKKADIVIFPEMAICGYPPEDLLLKEHFIDDNLEVLRRLIEKKSNLVVIAGFADRDKKGKLYNAAAIISKNKLLGVYHKSELPNYGVFDEKRYFHQGKDFPVFKTAGAVLGINICEDIWKVKRAAKFQADKGANLIINISASPYHAGKGNEREEMLKERAKETKAYICYCNMVGGQDELVFDGDSLIVSPEAKIIARAKQFEEDLVVMSLPIGGNKTLKSALAERKPKKINSIEEIYSALVLGTRDYLRKNGFKRAVIGLSGGIDSALTAAAACDAVGRENVIGVSMPSKYSSTETQSDAKILANNLGIEFKEIPIKEIFDSYLKTFSKKFESVKTGITEENIQARIRGNILMALSNEFGWLVLTTGNKSETSVGYCTLYGDMAGGFAVIKDVPKTIVYELSKFRNEKEKKPLIPESILKREPSAELKPGQKDKDTLPAYSVLDPILRAYVEEDQSYEKIIAKKFDSTIVKNVIKMVDRNEYKRRQAPLGIRITPKAFGKDRRLPVTNKYKEFNSG
ncbi:MAG: NAD+ synthase [Candidatus Omnitrophota bacterium]